MKIIGITGTIGSGKSEVAEVFAEHGAYVIDADVEAKALLEEGEAGYEAVVKAFGHGVLDGRGKIDKKRLASRVFSDERNVRKINKLIHPLLHVRLMEKLQVLRKQKKSLIVIDAPLLIEGGFHRIVDQIILVTPGDDELAVKRASQRIGISVEEARLRLSYQIPQEEKEKLADIVIVNDGTLQSLKDKAKEVVEMMLKEEGSRKV